MKKFNTLDATLKDEFDTHVWGFKESLFFCSLLRCSQKARSYYTKKTLKSPKCLLGPSEACACLFVCVHVCERQWWEGQCCEVVPPTSPLFFSSPFSSHHNPPSVLTLCLDVFDRRTENDGTCVRACVEKLFRQSKRHYWHGKGIRHPAVSFIFTLVKSLSDACLLSRGRRLAEL